jgi:cell division protein FtsB
MTYTEVREVIKDVLKAAADEAELVKLRARVAELEGQIAGAVDSTDAVEAGARAGLPAQ